MQFRDSSGRINIFGCEIIFCCFVLRCCFPRHIMNAGWNVVYFRIKYLTLIKIPLKRDASGSEGCSDTSGMNWEFCIRQRSDYVAKVKDHRWASNWITLESEWTVQGCTLREWRVVRKYGLFTFVFLHVFNYQTNVTIFVWKIYSLNLLLIWLKELLLHKGSVKKDEYYGMFWALYYLNGRSGR